MKEERASFASGRHMHWTTGFERGGCAVRGGLRLPGLVRPAPRAQPLRGLRHLADQERLLPPPRMGPRHDQGRESKKSQQEFLTSL